MMQSKVVFFFGILVFVFANVGCGDKFKENLRDKHVIPYVPVYTVINFSVGGEGTNWAYQPKYYNLSSDGKPLGYNGHGIVIYTEDNDTYKCYDATCTNCTDLTSHFTADDFDGSYVRCPVCGISFFLLYGMPYGNEHEIYPLKEYPITKTNNRLVVNY